MTTSERAKRRVTYVDPVVKKGVRYEELRGARSRGFNQNGGVLVAYDNDSGDELWTLLIYETKYDPNEESDVQDVFFKKLSASWFGNELKIVNERGAVFTVDPDSRTVTRK
jgi:hypothetical protein